MAYIQEAYKQERRTAPRISCYSRSMTDENIENGLVMDISTNGACVTVSKNTHIFSDKEPGQPASSYGRLSLSIFHPDYALENCLNIEAYIVWLDHEYSKDRLSFGVQFANMDGSKTSYVGKFIDWLQKKENYFLHCELENSR